MIQLKQGKNSGLNKAIPQTKIELNNRFNLEVTKDKNIISYNKKIH